MGVEAELRISESEPVCVVLPKEEAELGCLWTGGESCGDSGAAEREGSAARRDGDLGVNGRSRG